MNLTALRSHRKGQGVGEVLDRVGRWNKGVSGGGSSGGLPGLVQVQGLGSPPRVQAGGPSMMMMGYSPHRSPARTTPTSPGPLNSTLALPPTSPIPIPVPSSSPGSRAHGSPKATLLKAGATGGVVGGGGGGLESLPHPGRSRNHPHPHHNDNDNEEEDEEDDEDNVGDMASTSFDSSLGGDLPSTHQP